MAKKCYLKNRNNGHIIELKDKVECILGRNKFTNIRDLFVSKEQVSCTAEFKNFEISLKWLGPNMSGINGYALKRNIVYKLTHGDVIELILGKLAFEIVFDPVPQNAVKENKAEELKEKESTKGKCKLIPEEKSKIASIFNVGVKKKCVEWEWKHHKENNNDLYMFQSKEFQSTTKVAGYDLDGTLITTVSGLTFPKNIDDWKFFCSSVPKKLQQLHEDSYQIVIFTNQNGIKAGKLTVSDFKKKLETIVTKLNVPIRAFISIGDGKYRKPRLGMWEELVKTNNDLSVDKTNSFYCGDAAGRPGNWKPKLKKDHSSCDRLFARNIGIPFFTPEEHFLNEKPAEFIEPTFHPKTVPNKSLTEPASEKIIASEPEVLVLVGLPASGKSLVCSEYLIPADYTWINRDTLKTADKCLRMAEKALREGKKVVIDNTNVDVQSRAPYIQLAKKFNVPVRCGIMNVPTEQCFHNNLFRQLTDSTHALITAPIMNTFKSKYEEPTVKEGFKSVFKINFVPRFLDKKSRDLYEQYLLEK